MSRHNIKPWFELWLEVPHRLADDVGALLIGEGASGVEQRVVQESSDRTLVAAAFPSFSRPQELLDAGRRALGQLGIGYPDCPTHVVFRQDGDWAERWKEFFRPIKLGSRLWISPSWEKTFTPPNGDRMLTLDPGMAFGTGQHPTTALSLALMEKAITAYGPGRAVQVLDVGTGSGILAMAAVRLGAQEALGTDIDPEAVRVARENVQANRLEGSVHIVETCLQDITGSFPVVVANILAPTLIGLAADLIAHLSASATLIVSGILQGETGQVAQALIAASKNFGGMPIHETAELVSGDWAALALTRGTGS